MSFRGILLPICDREFQAVELPIVDDIDHRQALIPRQSYRSDITRIIRVRDRARGRLALRHRAHEVNRALNGLRRGGRHAHANQLWGEQPCRRRPRGIIGDVCIGVVR